MVNAEENNASSGGAPEPEQFRKLFIGGLTTNTTDEMLKEFYEQWGELVDCIVMRDSATKRSRGFGFVTYSSRAQVDTCMAARPHIIDGKTVDPKRAVPRELSTRSEANVSTKRLYVSGVREDHNDQMFRDYFQRFGPVHEVEVIQDKNTGKNRGFAFVTFEDYDAVDQCVLAKSHMIDNKRCDVKKALSKEEMKKAQQTDRERTERGVRSRDPPGRGEQGGWGGGGGYGGGGGGWGGGGGGGGYGGGYSGGAGGGWGGGGGGAAYGAAGGYGGGYDAGSWAGGAGAGWNAGGSAGGQGGWGAPAGGAMSQQQYWPPAPAPNPAPAAGGWGAAGGAGAASWGAGGGGGAAGHAAGGQWSGRSY